MEKDVFEKLEAMGIEFFVFMWNGHTKLTTDLVREFAKLNLSKEELQAKLFGVSIETYRKWREWIAEGAPCQAKTRKGTRCTKSLDWPREFGPAEFETDGFCVVHRERMNR